MAMKQLRMCDIAARAGVSQPTVSLVLSGRTDVRISQDTRRRVIAIAKDLGYRLNGTARNLAAGRTNAVAFLYDASAGFLLDDPFCRGIFSGIIEATETENLSLIFSVYNQNTKSVSAVERKLVDGILYLAGKNLEVIEYLKQAGMPFVALNPDIDVPEDCITITMQDDRAGAIVASKVCQARHKRVLFVNASWEGKIPASYRARMEHFCRACPGTRCEALPLEDGVGNSFRLGRRAADVVRNETAVVCVNDQIAWGLITALEEQGRRVPGDISVAGFDGLEPDFTAHLKVLSTVVFDRFVIGHEGFLTLRRLISGQTAKSWQLPPKWRAGETLAVLKSQR